jgi:Mor family transcriptional regulator
MNPTDNTPTNPIQAASSEDIEIKDLHPTYQMLACIIGIDNTLRIGQELGGTNVYIPKPDNALRTYRNGKIQKEFNGHNYEELARKYHVSVRHAREVIERARIQGQNKRPGRNV